MSVRIDINRYYSSTHEYKKNELSVSRFETSSELYISAFLKIEEKDENTSDLTRDGGQLAWKIIKNHYKSKIPFDNIVDIGGQDPDFLKKFPSTANRILIDRNMLTPFFRKKEKISYAIGNAVEILKDKNFLADRKKGKMLVSMSNLLNVVRAPEAWKIINATVEKMKPSDSLAITNLSNEQFKDNIDYEIGEQIEGIVEYHKINKNSSKGSLFYKSTFSEGFISSLSDRFPNLKCLQQTTVAYQCAIKSSVATRQRSKNRLVKVFFTTLLLEKI